VTMDCADARSRILDLARGRLDAAMATEVRAHLDACRDCAHLAEAESVLTEVLEQRLPQHAAPHALKRRLREQWPMPAARPGWHRRWRGLAWAATLALVVLLVAPIGWDRVVRRPDREVATRLVDEAVNDHLRVLFSQQPLEVRAGGIHQVRPWFAGRLDFAPVVRFAGDDEFPLQGGAIGYFVDRKAAVVGAAGRRSRLQRPAVAPGRARVRPRVGRRRGRAARPGRPPHLRELTRSLVSALQHLADAGSSGGVSAASSSSSAPEAERRQGAERAGASHTGARCLDGSCVCA
jgi:anti-sigma factor (TIGR02949 family)